MPKADTQIITMQCEQCKNRNYTTTKNRKAHSGRLELRKYCKFCRTHTVHREVR